MNPLWPLLLAAAATNASVAEPTLPERAPEGDPAFVRMPGGGYIHTAREGGHEVRRVVVPAALLMREGPIELFACGEGGKDHESIFRIEADVQQLDLALVLIGLRKGPTPDRADEQRRTGDRVAVLAQWEEGDRTVTRWSHDLILDTRTRQPMPRCGWTFVGTIAEIMDTVTGRPTGRHILLAAQSRSVVTTFRDTTSILDNPLSEPAADDERYVPNTELLPSAGTRVRLIFRAPFEGELRDE